MDQTQRNTNRTNDRNEVAFEKFASDLPGIGKMGFFYQYCNNKTCREFELFILAHQNGASEEELAVFNQIIATTKTDGLVLEYPDIEPVSAQYLRDGSEPFTKKQTWDEIVNNMSTKHVFHEEGNSACAQYKHELLKKGTWSSSEHDTEFSNQARRVPGVRHIDTDGILYCEDCHVPLFAIEATSDGCPGTALEHKRKATSMTQRVAKTINAAPALIQHHYHDEDHEHPVYLTTWKDGKKRMFERTWATLANDFTRRLEQHKSEGCHASGAS